MNREERRKQAREVNKLLNKLKDIVVNVHNTKGLDKMFICINPNVKRGNNTVVIPYKNNEKLEQSLGSGNIVVLGDKELHNRTVLLGELVDGNKVSIRDGQGEYIIKLSNI